MAKKIIKCQKPKTKEARNICKLINSPNAVKVYDKKGNLIRVKISKSK